MTTEPALTVCATCRHPYDHTDADQVRRHTEPVDCSCTRCRGKASCYMCMGSFCFCHAH